MAEEKQDSVDKVPEGDQSIEANQSAAGNEKSVEDTESKDNQTDKLNEMQTKLDEMENKYLRAEAEIKNIQNHARKERADLIKYDGQQLAHDILPVIDNLQRALSVEVTDENGQQLKQGVQMVTEHLQKALSDNGIEKISAEGSEFDPKYHQAIQTVDADDDHKADTVVQVLQEGYRLKDRVLRPAMVVVAK